MGLRDHARLPGAVSAAEVRRRLVAAYIFVLASWHEPLGVASMEAMACEVPVIGTDAGGVAELITHGEDGLLVAPKSPGALAETLFEASRWALDQSAASPGGMARSARIGQSGR